MTAASTSAVAHARAATKGDHLPEFHAKGDILDDAASQTQRTTVASPQHPRAAAPARPNTALRASGALPR